MWGRSGLTIPRGYAETHIVTQSFRRFISPEP